MITAATLKTILEAACLAAACARGKTGGTYGTGVGVKGGNYGASSRVAAIQTAVAGSGDLELQGDLARSIVDAVAACDGIGYAASLLSPLLTALQGHASRAGVPNVRTLDDLLVYFNTAQVTKWQVLCDPIWREVYPKWMGGSLPSAIAVGAYSDNLGARTHGGAFAAGTPIDSALYAGGFPKLLVAGLSGSGTVTVTGTARDPATKGLVLARTWTVAVNANGTVALAPGGGSAAPADSLIVAVTDVALGAGINGGTFTVQAETSFARAVV